MKLGRILGEADLRRPIKDLRDLLGDSESEREPGGVMARDLETMVSVDCVLASRNRFMKRSETAKH